MSISSEAFTRIIDPVEEHAPASASNEATQVLITTHEVLFSTAAARGVRPDRTGGRIGFGRFFAASTNGDRPRQRQEARRYAFLENALMSREMDRL
ncbi:hypothetical protein A9W99_17925 [Mycobacterium sp. 1164966.3]|uniref:hypothetical protein n=1 Tax=Mycobacterium sp. 1164966.3 TaxID=1856861 RepID=UPI0007FF2DF7|nr:hypothetical protein [Mycobacterium sp. 1164966.3]OBA79994.1 hypothetical protein A9W99_17925 [Mycobacterium sp. 1164966.3]